MDIAFRASLFIAPVLVVIALAAILLLKSRPAESCVPRTGFVLPLLLVGVPCALIIGISFLLGGAQAVLISLTVIGLISLIYAVCRASFEYAKSEPSQISPSPQSGHRCTLAVFSTSVSRHYLKAVVGMPGELVAQALTGL